MSSAQAARTTSWHFTPASRRASTFAGHLALPTLGLLSVWIGTLGDGESLGRVPMMLLLAIAAACLILARNARSVVAAVWLACVSFIAIGTGHPSAAIIGGALLVVGFTDAVKVMAWNHRADASVDTDASVLAGHGRLATVVAVSWVCAASAAIAGAVWLIVAR